MTRLKKRNEPERVADATAAYPANEAIGVSSLITSDTRPSNKIIRDTPGARPRTGSGRRCGVEVEALKRGCGRSGSRGGGLER